MCGETCSRGSEDTGQEKGKLKRTRSEIAKSPWSNIETVLLFLKCLIDSQVSEAIGNSHQFRNSRRVVYIFTVMDGNDSVKR